MARKSVGLIEIAKLANVSLGTVDRALHNRGRVGEETRERILGIAKTVGYKPNLAARALSMGPTATTVVVCIPREIHYFFDQLRDGILEEAKYFEHVGLQIQYAPIDRLGAGEDAAIQSIIKSNPQALILAPGQADVVTPMINEAEEKGIRVVCVDSDAPQSRRTAVVSVDAQVAGRIAAELLGGFGSPATHVAVVTGFLQNDDHCRRVTSFTKLFESICLNGSVVGVIEDHENEEECFQKCCRLLEKEEKISALYVTTANCLPVCRAVNTLNLSHRIKLIASDLFLEMIPYFDMGIIAASIYARPFAQGRLALRLIMDKILYGYTIRTQNYLAPQIVTRSSTHLFREAKSLRAAGEDIDDW